MLCRGCGLIIVDRYLLKIGDTYWHEHCVKCETCGSELHEKCYSKFGTLYCADDYFRQYSTNRCFVCGLGIAPYHMVFKLHKDIICHAQCQRCAVCDVELGAGSRLAIDHRGHRLLCQFHGEQSKIAESELNNTANRQPTKGMPTAVPKCETVPLNASGSGSCASLDGAQGQFSQCDGVEIKLGAVSSTVNLSDMEQRQLGCGNARYVRRRGPRTTIRPSQLETLNRIFGATPKPSKQARARLALETGLSMRVIQVWFQNRRSKERRLKHLCNWIRQNEGRASSGVDSGLPPLLSSGSADMSLMDDDHSGLEDLLESDSESGDDRQKSPHGDSY